MCIRDSLGTLATLNRVMSEAGPDAVLQPVHAGRSGHPVGFGRGYFAALEKLTGDEGARRVLESAACRLVRFEVNDPGVLQDVDTPSDLSMD